MEIQEYNKRRALLVSMLKYVETEFLGLFMFLFYIGINRFLGIFGNIFFGLCALLVIVCIMADFGMKEGTIAKNKVTLHGAKPCKNFGAAMGLVASVPAFVMVVILLLSKLGAVGNFLPLYKIVNTCFYPFFILAAPDKNIADMSWAAFILPVLFSSLYIISTWLGFRISYSNVDVRDKIMYKNK